jgi:hypothetical protein
VSSRSSARKRIQTYCEISDNDDDTKAGPASHRNLSTMKKNKKKDSEDDENSSSSSSKDKKVSDNSKSRIKKPWLSDEEGDEKDEVKKKEKQNTSKIKKPWLSDEEEEDDEDGSESDDDEKKKVIKQPWTEDDEEDEKNKLVNSKNDHRSSNKDVEKKDESKNIENEEKKLPVVETPPAKLFTPVTINSLLTQNYLQPIVSQPLIQPISTYAPLGIPNYYYPQQPPPPPPVYYYYPPPAAAAATAQFIQPQQIIAPTTAQNIMSVANLTAPSIVDHPLAAAFPLQPPTQYMPFVSFNPTAPTATIMTSQYQKDNN